MPAQITTLSGKVMPVLVSPGSKSEHQGVVLRTEQGESYVLRRAGGNAFRDESLESLIGATISGRGIVAGGTFIMRDWSVKNSG